MRVIKPQVLRPLNQFPIHCETLPLYHVLVVSLAYGNEIICIQWHHSDTSYTDTHRREMLLLNMCFKKFSKFNDLRIP